jgi:Holliday junction resolvase RusA-like endonuclease
MKHESIRVSIKALSVNEAWQGKRYKTAAYRRYERDLGRLLPRHISIPEGPLRLCVEWGMSRMSGDVDNPLKPFIDVLQKRYGFDDKRIHELWVRKTRVMRGAEYIDFSLSRFSPQCLPVDDRQASLFD